MRCLKTQQKYPNLAAKFSSDVANQFTFNTQGQRFLPLETTHSENVSGRAQKPSFPNHFNHT